MSNALRCDGCGRFANAGQDDKDGYGRRMTPLPAGWLRVHLEDRTNGAEFSAGDTADVCSRACGAAWLNREVEA